ncbi:phosphoserine phosphatase [Sorangium cellulosum]|uniref:Phosphoserine phosphatase n=1 Tax=Sorangium cellulosum TaxID=56 RepID=A0A2L0EZZ6_SORCE|nr:SpoIIE family protein phosphatase [Sorangium cellulosum]AUX44897.1 phosphoserine phosphatase [Sorangium cellulosum]
MTKQRRTIALLMDYVRGEYQSALRIGVERAAEAHDVNLVIAVGETLAGHGPSEAATNSIYRLVGDELVDGVVIAAGTLCNYVGVEGMRSFCRSYAPLPLCSIGLALEGVPSVVVDNGLGIEMAVGHLIDDHARRRVVYLGGPTHNGEASLRAEAYRRALLARAIPYDERLVAVGEFTIDTGRAAMAEILGRGVAFDAVVAANDNMALGAIEQLKASGRDVPKDVLVCGFDDVGVARYTKPSLTTVRQPIKRLGELALETVLRILDGEVVPERNLQQIELTRRESCGCAFQAVAGAPWGSRRAGALALGGRPEDLERALELALGIPSASLGAWPAELLAALEEELAGREGRFLRALERLLDAAAREGLFLDLFQGVITLLRARLRRPPEDPAAAATNEALEQLWHACRVLIGSASVRAEGRQRLEVEVASIDLSWSGRWLSTCLSLPLLKRMLASEMPRLHFTHVALSLYEDAQRTALRPLYVMEDGREVDAPFESFPVRQLAPPGFLRSDERRRSMVVMPITLGNTEHFGVMALDSGVNEMVYDALRLQLGSAVKTVALHREVVRQLELRERLEQERGRQESVVAARIQTTLVPERPEQQAIEGLEVCAVMKPATEVGGDYYDVIATPGGGWLGIGDVAGHGLAAGLVMLMIQSMVTALTSKDPGGGPRELVVALNRAVYKNVRGRLKRDDYATLLLLRYERSGRVKFAGAHEDIVVCRARTGRCACIPSTGVWIGALPDVDGMTRDAELVLEDGDVLVLYSDGVTEARSAHHEQFGLERLCATIEAVQASPVEVIRDRILSEVEGWSPSPDDDITIVVARYSAPP